MIKWHLATDTLEKGQWLSGRVYPERSALSPNGELFLYFTVQPIGQHLHGVGA